MINLEKIRQILSNATPAPWEADCEEDPQSSSFSTSDGSCVGFVQPYGNINTIIKTGKQFSDDDAKLIVWMRNNIEVLLKSYEELQKIKQEQGYIVRGHFGDNESDYK